MKKFALVLVLFCVSNLLLSQDDLEMFYENGNLKLTKTFYTECNCDTLKEYYESGNLKRKASYQNIGLETLIFGEEFTYFENKNVATFYYYKNGFPEGKAFENYENGAFYKKMFFLNGFKSGVWKTYNQAGDLTEEITQEEFKTKFGRNTKNGVYKYYNNGLLTTTIIYRNNEVVETTQHVKEDSKSKKQNLGEKLFKENCAACHHKTIKLAGPPLQGVVENRSLDWLILMIKDGDDLVKSGDFEANTLYKKFNYAQHPTFDYLSDEEVNEIIDYLKTF